MALNTKIAIAEDNPFLLKAIKEKLSFFSEAELKFHAGNGVELLSRLAENHNLDVILMDIEMPVMNGIETTAQVKQQYPHIKIIILTVFDDDENIFRCIKAGADGYLLKEVEAGDLINGINETLNGGAAMTPSIAMKTLKLLRNPVEFDGLAEKDCVKLSARETDVLEQLSKGLSYTRIAENLFLSPATVRKHIENIYQKLQVHSKLEAVQKAKSRNLI